MTLILTFCIIDAFVITHNSIIFLVFIVTVLNDFVSFYS